LSTTEKYSMKTLIIIVLLISIHANANDTDTRQLVEFPTMMQTHMMSNMRDHLVTINQILSYLANDELDKAAEIAENNLGMGSLKSHNASHMAKFMPEGMRNAGTNMHKAASRFALVAEEGDAMESYKALTEITTACVACHAGYKVQ